MAKEPSKKTQMGSIKAVLGIHDDAEDEEKDAEASEAAEEAAPERHRAARHEAPAEEEAPAQEAPAPKLIPAENVLNLTKTLPLIPIQGFTVIPVQNDEHVLLIGWTIENEPALKIQASGKAIAGLKETLLK